MTAADDFVGDRGNLSRRLAQAEDDFRETLADAAMVIDAGEPEIFERTQREAAPISCCVRGRRQSSVAASHLCEQILSSHLFDVIRTQQ